MISLCVTTHNRFALLLESIEQVLDDERVSEIIISDDASDKDVFNAIVEHYKPYPKVKVHRNLTNQGVYQNKYTSVVLAKNDWIIVADSDNVFDKRYLDTLFALPEWDKRVAYSPEFGKTQFDFTHLSGKMINKHNVASLFREKHFESLINLMNYFVNRSEFIRLHDNSMEPISADSIYKNYLWFEAGNSLYVTPGLQYVHRVHKGSHYVNNCGRSNVIYNKIASKLKAMR